MSSDRIPEEILKCQAKEKIGSKGKGGITGKILEMMERFNFVIVVTDLSMPSFGKYHHIIINSSSKLTTTTITAAN
jgi:hypothetical protein